MRLTTQPARAEYYNTHKKTTIQEKKYYSRVYREMEEESENWRIRGKSELRQASGFRIRNVLLGISSNVDPNDTRSLIRIGHGDPTPYPCFRPAPAAVAAVSAALHSAAFNSYSPSTGILPARQAVAKYLSQDLPYTLSPDDVYLTAGCHHSIEVALGVLESPGTNILLPRPGYPSYDSHSEICKLEVRHYDLLPEKDWEVDLDSVEALADENTVAIVIINPGNPCGNVYSHDHLQKVAETARKLGLLVIADEVYAGVAFGSNPFVPMGAFGSIAPVLTLGSISKRWIVPGWRLGWIVTSDPNGLLKKFGIAECIERFLNLSCDPVTFVQGAIPQILEDTKDDFFLSILDTLRKDVDICWEKLGKIPCITCPYKPQGGMSIVAKLDLCMMDGIKDDLDFCNKLAREESVIVLPGFAVGMKNWVRISFAIEPTVLEEALERIEAFCQRHKNLKTIGE